MNWDNKNKSMPEGVGFLKGLTLKMAKLFHSMGSALIVLSAFFVTPVVFAEWVKVSDAQLHEPEH